MNVHHRMIRERGDAAELQSQAWTSFDAGEHRKAAQIIGKAIDAAQSASPQDELLLAQLYLERGMFRWYSEDYRSAIEDYSAAIALRPDHWEGYLHRWQTYLKLGDAARAAEDRETGMRLRPDVFSSEYPLYRGVI